MLFRGDMDKKEAREIAQEISDLLLRNASYSGVIHGVSKTPKEFTLDSGLEGYCVEVQGTLENLPADVPNPYKGIFIVYNKGPRASI